MGHVFGDRVDCNFLIFGLFCLFLPPKQVPSGTFTEGLVRSLRPEGPNIDAHRVDVRWGFGEGHQAHSPTTTGSMECCELPMFIALEP